ncbi:NAD-dependent epimerase/dehydratase family protein [Salisediminibacterium selenitireducens]|uniref:NAD-dependent epimerase/dehydratase n=1 Tax=Bacillus selenitireducens (strain ATCC 700615 / DSM 15326 / MLS10) TaxID=439292 RepID=D6Y026_BACIE|nr:NAD-dependent epimerase/dehydratase family protein [Salisediminibacterium selenitireducens]ADI00528.1 NAD-dependent epimerase/dehydratase [[Bacillus] selenitireducens MLS10]
MKRILITGKNSYIGNSFEKWLAKDPQRYKVDKISVRDDSWKKINFSSYDTILHVAGIAHLSERKVDKDLYYKVNRDLAINIANKAKDEGVKQFIFTSSMSVYGKETGIIDKDTPTMPKSNYGKSKLEAERLISELDEIDYKVSIIRPPMIYGRSCKGNYVKLSSLARRTPVFPNIKNQRSMIYIDNLNEYIKTLVNNPISGLFFPQNKDYVCTSDMVKEIASVYNKRVWMTKLFNPLLININIEMSKKIFGDLVYCKHMDENYRYNNYNLVNFKESIRLTEE